MHFACAFETSLAGDLLARASGLRSKTNGAGSCEGDQAVVDSAMGSAHGHIVAALLNNEPVCKRLCIRGKEVILLSENPKYPPRYVLEGDELVIWGVITCSVRSHA